MTRGELTMAAEIRVGVTSEAGREPRCGRRRGLNYVEKVGGDSGKRTYLRKDQIPRMFLLVILSP